jgi:zinc protease
LRKSSDPRMSYETLQSPPLLFRFDPFFFALAAFAVWMAVWRKLFSRPFAHERVRWTRKIGYPPAYLLQATLLWAVCSISMLLFVLAHRLALKNGIHLDATLANSYLNGILSLGVVTFVYQLIYGSIARKLIVVGDSLWIKSLGYRSRVLPLVEIKSIKLVRPLELTPANAFRIRLRYDYFHFWLLKKGLLIQLNSGRSYYLGVSHPEHAIAELTRLCEERKQLAATSEPRSEQAA